MNPQILGKQLLNNKKAVTAGQQWSMIIVVLLAFSGIVFGGLWFFSAAPPEEEAVPSGDGAPVTPSTTTGITCDSDKRADFRTRYKDLLQKSVVFVADITTYAQPTDGRAVRVTGTNTTAGGSFSSNANSLICDDVNAVKYNPVARTYIMGETSGNPRAGYISDSRPTVVAQGAEVNVDFLGKRQDRLQMIISDNTAGITTAELNNTNSVGLGFAATGGGIGVSGTTNFTTQNGQGIVIAAGQELDISMRIKANTTNTQFGEDDFGFDANKVFKERSSDSEELFSVIISVDTSSATDWSSNGPVINRVGTSVIEIKSADLLIEDAQALNAYDFFYITKPFTDQESILNFLLDAADSATNPASSPFIRFVALGKYNSQDLTDTLRISGFDDSTSRAEVAFKTANEVRISVV